MKGKFQPWHEKKILVKNPISMCVYLDSNGLIASYLAIYKQASLKNNEHVRESTEFIPAADETQQKKKELKVWGCFSLFFFFTLIKKPYFSV